MQRTKSELNRVLHEAIHAAALIAALSACLMLSGCNIVGPVAAVAAGPPKVDARYTLADVPTVVFVDDRQNLVSPITLRRSIADKASQELMANKLVTTTINPQDAILIASRSDRTGALMDIEAIGRAVGAQQIVYVQITQFADTPDGYTPIPTGGANVKVIDVNSGQRMFPGPDMAGGYPIKSAGKPIDPSLYSSRPSRMKIFESLSLQLGDEIAKLFYKHESVDLGARLQ